MIFSTMQLHAQPSSLPLEKRRQTAGHAFSDSQKDKYNTRKAFVCKKRESHFLPVEQPLALVVKLNCQPHHFALVRLERLGV